MRKRQIKKNNRTPKWLKQFRKNHDIKMIGFEKLPVGYVKTLLEQGEIGSLNNCELVGLVGCYSPVGTIGPVGVNGDNRRSITYRGLKRRK